MALNHKPPIPIFGNKTLDLIVNPRNTNQKVKLLPFRFPPVQATGKTNVTPDSPAKQTDSTAPLTLPLAPPIQLGIANLKASYREENQEAGDLEDLVARAN